MSYKRAPSRGFTLMEVLVTLTMIGILAAIAIPNYTAYIQRGYRSEAKAMLLQVAQWQQRLFTETNAYATAVPTGMAAVPATGTARYAVTTAVPAAGQFTVTATPVGPQAGDECGSFVIDNLGRRSVEIALTTYVSGTPEVTKCWGR